MMPNPGTLKKIVLAALLFSILLAVVIWQTGWFGASTPVPEHNDSAAQAQRPGRTEPIARPRSAAAAPETAQESAEDVNPMQLSREKIEEYLKQHRRDAASLLAAYHASFDAEHNKANLDYLREAATNYPNDPRVQLAVLAQNAFPEDRRQWLDAIKASSPSNSLANYLSAREYFKNNQTDAAIKELAEATGKAQFTDYSMESYLGTEDLFRSSGASPRITCTAAMSAMSQDLLPQLSGLKGVVNGVSDLQKQYVAAGDSASVENLAQMGISMANRFSQGDGGRFLIGQLVGMSIESIALQSLDQNTAYDFLGGQTPAQRLEANKEQRKAFRELTASSSALLLTVTDAEMVAYADRVKVYGEVPAMRWFQQQRAAGATPNIGN
jgi:hypothetical protein